MLQRIIVIDPRPETRDRLRGSSVEVRCEDPYEMATLWNAGVDHAAMVVSLSVPGTDTPGSLPAIVHWVRSLSRNVRVLVLATDCAHGSELRLAGADEVFHIAALDDLHHTLSKARRSRGDRTRRSDGALGRLLNWRFAVLIAITIVDAIVFVIPLALSAVLVAAVLAPHSLRRVARFLDDLAGSEGA